MKALALLTLLISARAGGNDFCELHGRVRVVQGRATYRVRRVSIGGDIRVRLVDSLPNDAGKWQMVSNNADFTIQWVDNMEDFRVQFVNDFAGCPSD